MTEVNGSAPQEQTGNNFQKAFEYAVQPKSETKPFFPITDDWRLKNIQKKLPQPNEISVDQPNSLKLYRNIPHFHIQETGDISAIQEYALDEEKSTYGWRTAGSNVSDTKSLRGEHAILKVPITSIQFINDEKGQVFDMHRFLGELDPTKSKTKFFQVFGMDINAESDTEILFAYPKDIANIFSLFHEIGHRYDATQYEEEFNGSVFSLYEFSKRGKFGENKRLAELSTRERNAWAFSYRVLKQLRQGGFIRFTDEEFINHMQNSLATYEDATKNIPGNYTPVTHFLSSERAKQRQEYVNPTLSQRFTHLKRKVLGK